MQRDALILTGAVVIAIAVGVFIFISNGGSLSYVFSSTAINTPAAYTVPFTNIARGSQSTVDRRVNYYVTSVSQFGELWKMVNATGTPPYVDFKTQAVIAVFAGKEPVSSISVAKIADTDARMVSITIMKLDSECTTKELSAPKYEIVAVSATTLPLTHTDVVTTASCPK